MKITTISECEKFARKAYVSATLFSALFTEFFGDLTPSWRQFMVHGLRKAIYIVLVLKQCPRFAGEEGFENMNLPKASTASRLSGMLSIRGISRENAETGWVRKIMQTINYSSTILTRFIPDIYGAIADARRADKRAKKVHAK